MPTRQPSPREEPSLHMTCAPTVASTEEQGGRVTGRGSNAGGAAKGAKKGARHTHSGPNRGTGRTGDREELECRRRRQSRQSPQMGVPTIASTNDHGGRAGPPGPRGEPVTPHTLGTHVGFHRRTGTPGDRERSESRRGRQGCERSSSLHRIWVPAIASTKAPRGIGPKAGGGCERTQLKYPQ